MKEEVPAFCCHINLDNETLQSFTTQPNQTEGNPFWAEEFEFEKIDRGFLNIIVVVYLESKNGGEFESMAYGKVFWY